MKRLLLALVFCGFGCATTQVAKYDDSYRSDTLLVDKLMVPLGVEPSHGQVTVAVAKRFTEKLLQASIYPNVLTLSVATPGPVWKKQIKKLSLSFDNEVALKEGKVDITFSAQDLELNGDLIKLHGIVNGHGVINADMKIFGVGLVRDVELWTSSDDDLQLHLEKGDKGWLLRMIGPPLKLHVNVKVPAVKVGMYDLVPIKITRELEFPVSSIAPFNLPLPTPQTVKVGPTAMSLGLQNMAMGTHDGVLWVGADLVVGDAVTSPPAPATPAPAPAAPAPAAPAAPAVAAPATPPAPKPAPASQPAPKATKDGSTKL